MRLKTTKKNGTHRILVQGEATIYGVTEAMGVLRASLRTARRVEIDLSQASETDSAFAQLLLAARLQGQRDGKAVEFRGYHALSTETLVILSSLDGGGTFIRPKR